MIHTGLLAHSPDGAALAFSEFCHLGPKRFSAPVHPDITLDYIAMGRTLPAWDRGDAGAVREVLAESVSRLAKSGAEFFFCPDNTAHIALESSGPDLAIPGLNIADIVAQKASASGFGKVGILGTRFTMAGPVYPRALAAHGIDWAVPEHGEEINRIIFEELVNGVILDQSRVTYCNAIDDLKARGCDSVALVCTEIPLLIAPSDSSLPILDSTRLIAEAAFNVGVGEAPLPTWRGGPL
ncbi:MAG: amino acid racemase [Henriciella sp.]|jgi:aspartate racemase